MKNIFKNKLSIIKYCVTIALVFFMWGCENYLDVDTDTDAPVSAPLNQLLPNIQLGLKNMGDYNFWSGDILIVYVHQMTAREEQDQYGTKPANILMNNEWDNTYLTLTDMKTLYAQGTANGDMMYVGITQIMEAYMMSETVDLWGDVPYSEATQLEAGVVGAVFDDQKEIYRSLLDLIDTGKANINSGEGLSVGSEDLFYGGNLTKWIKFANTLKIKLYNQVKNTDVFDSADFNALVAENNFFTSNADDFQFNHTGNESPTDERNQLYLASYGGTQVSYYQSPWFYEILMGWNPNIHNGNVDPRIPYYFVNQLEDGQLPPDQGIEDPYDPNADYWDAATGFFSIRFGSIGPDRDGSVQTSATFPGIFPAGGMYDDNSGPTININSGTGIAPHRILTYDEFLYIQAELMLSGFIPGSAEGKLEEAITASFAKVDQVVAGTGTSQSVPVLSGSSAVTTFITNVMAEFGAASTEKKLEIIMTQKWVATFGDPMDAYSDYRRTGYPVLANPEGSSPEYQLNNNDGFPILDSQTVLNNPFQESIFWPQAELNLNQNAPAQKDPGAYEIFWAQ